MKESPKDNLKLMYGVVVSVLYIGVSYLIIFTPYLLPYSVGNQISTEDNHFIVRIFLGTVLFVYGIFRGYRVFKSWKN